MVSKDRGEQRLMSRIAVNEDIVLATCQDKYFKKLERGGVQGQGNGNLSVLTAYFQYMEIPPVR